MLNLILSANSDIT